MRMIEHLRKCAVASKNFTVSLIGDISQIAATVADALDEMDGAKANKPSAVSVTIPASGWSSGSGDYPYYYDIAVAGVTENDRAEITISPGSIGTAIACGMCPTNETLAGKIRVRSSKVPSSAIAAEYWIEDGKE